MLKQIVDPRNWGFAQYVTVCLDSCQANSVLNYDTDGNNSVLNLVTTQKIQNKEMVSVSVLNLIEEVSKVRNRILGIHAAVAKFMVPIIENFNMYGNTPWSCLTSEEKN